MSNRESDGKKCNDAKENLRKKVLRYLWRQGYSTRSGGFSLGPDPSKEDIRNLHARQRRFRLEKEGDFVRQNAMQLALEFAEGSEINPSHIAPELVPVLPNTRESMLFRFACLLWSVPTSAGFGRRLRYLVRDASNGRLMGIFALGDPVFNLRVRDEWIGWNSEQKAERLCNVMEAYVVGAVPPYSQLLGGKLVAALAASNEVRRDFSTRYGLTTAVISGRCKHPRLVLVTTNSALGRSSMYNRLRICDVTRFNLIGKTQGYGYFHLDGGLFEEIRDLLVEMEHPYARGNRFGEGPNWKMRVLRVGLEELGIDTRVLRHGISREVYAVPLGTGVTEYLSTGDDAFRPYDLPAAEIAYEWHRRWLLPRTGRGDDWQSITRSAILASMLAVKPSLLRSVQKGNDTTRRRTS